MKAPARSTGTFWRGIGVRFGLVLAGLLVGLLALELVLQAAAAYTRFTGRPEPTGWLTGRQRIMCVGDSNTYGLHMARDQTYPHYLEQVWNTASPSRPVEVLNLGFPGMSSSRLRKNFSELLDTFHPQVVLMLVGVNDAWMAPVSIDDGGARSRRSIDVLWDYSRVFRFFYMLQRGVREYEISYRADEAVGAIRAGDQSIDLLPKDFVQSQVSRTWQEDLVKNLRAMVVEAERRDAQLVFLTYPSHRMLYGDGNKFLRAAAVGHTLIDLETGFRELCPTGLCARIFLQDQHPTAIGYQLAAALIWRGLQQAAMAPAPEEGAQPFRGLDATVVKLLQDEQAPVRVTPDAAIRSSQF